MNLPNFIIIGAAKSGTTSIYNYLGQHPEIYVIPEKEPAFFAFEGCEVKLSGPQDQEVYGRFVVTELKSYKALFNGVTNESAFGEGSVVYLYSSSAPARIKHYIPEAKLIAILRNPVDRAFSSYRSLRRDGREPINDFVDALKAEESRVNSGWEHQWHYLRLGFYATQLKRYFKLFPSSQISVYTYDDFCNNPLEILQSIFNFLSVDSNFVPDMAIRYNVSGVPKSRMVHTFLQRDSNIKTFLKNFVPSSLRMRLHNAAMAWNLDPPEMDLPKETQRNLLDLYTDEILELQSLFQIDLSRWLEI